MRFRRLFEASLASIEGLTLFELKNKARLKIIKNPKSTNKNIMIFEYEVAVICSASVVYFILTEKKLFGSVTIHQFRLKT